MSFQLSLGADAVPAIDRLARSVRHDLGRGAWVEHVHGLLHAPDPIAAALIESTRWKSESRVMYERLVEVPRLFARIPDDGEPHPIFEALGRWLQDRYRARFDSITLALYRHGSDSVAGHRDRHHRDRIESVVAIASLGGPRRFLVRPLGGGRSTAIMIRSGDLVTMGGSCQRTVEHCVPKVAQAHRRIAIMFRHNEPISPPISNTKR